MEQGIDHGVHSLVRVGFYIIKRELMTTISLGWNTTADEVLAGIDLTGKRALITGASAGLGVETARSLVKRGAEVVGTARDLRKAEIATREVFAMAKKSGGKFDLVDMDLASLASIRQCTDDLLLKGTLFDLIIANAGVMATPFGHTQDGFEMQFGTNHLGHFVFVNRLTSLLRPRGRVVSVASSSHRQANVDLVDPNFDHKPYDAGLAYSQSKTANILFAVEFDRRHRNQGIRAVAVHPGTIQTELGRHMDPFIMQQRIDQLNLKLEAEGKSILRWKSIPQGAATTVWASIVADADEIGGRYCENCHVVEPSMDDSFVDGASPHAFDGGTARDLWAKSEQLVGEVF